MKEKKYKYTFTYSKREFVSLCLKSHFKKVLPFTREREHFFEIFKNTGRLNYSALGGRLVPIY